MASVTVSPAHGGCGRTHSRPAPGGKPEKTWNIEPTCEPCASHLRHDPLWSPTISGIPETYDEHIQREDFDKRGVLDERRLMAMALAKLTGLQLPETIAAAIGGSPSVQVALCKDGHANSTAVKFCGECGVSMAEAQKAETAWCPAGHETPAGSRFCAECAAPVSDRYAPPGAPPGWPLSLPPAGGPDGLVTQFPDGVRPPEAPAVNGGARKPRWRDMRHEQLAALAREKDLPDTGTKADLIARLKAVA